MKEKILSKEEFSKEVYNKVYEMGGCDGSYHKHYTQSIYYDSWKNAFNYLLLLDRSTKILEIGCGSGQFANMLFDYGFFNYKGFDFSEEAVALAKRSNPEYEDCFFIADAFETPEVSDENELIICFEVLEHIQKDLELLSRIQRGTKVLFSVPNFDSDYHVRYFDSEQGIYDRYQSIVQIYGISKIYLSKVNCIYYIAGEKI